MGAFSLSLGETKYILIMSSPKKTLQEHIKETNTTLKYVKYDHGN